jgi:anti-anti-sigma factor
MQLLIRTEKKNNHTLFHLSGDLDYEGTCKLKDTFLSAVAADEKNFVLNLEALKIISSYALSIVLKLSYLAKKNEGTVKIICPPGNVSDIFFVLELARVLPLYSSEEELWASEKKGS